DRRAGKRASVSSCRGGRHNAATWRSIPTGYRATGPLPTTPGSTPNAGAYPPASEDRLAARHPEHRARDVARLVGGEEDVGRRDLDRVPGPPERHVGASPRPCRAPWWTG